MRYLESMKKIFVLSVSALCVSIVYHGPSTAMTTSEYYLAQIAQNTYNIMYIIQNPANFAGLAVSWMQQDTGDSSINTKAQQSFALTGAEIAISQLLQTSIQPTLTSDLLGRPNSDFTGKNAPVLSDMPDINNVVYSSLLGTPPVANAGVEPYAYIKNAAGFNTPRPMPLKTWTGTAEAKDLYKSYYSTVTAIQSFSAYVLSEIAIDEYMKSAFKLNDTQNQLVMQASSSEWIAHIATEELGRVLRQILLFESQNFVLNTQIQKNVQQMVAAQTMTNTLLMMINQVNENQLISNAKGTPAG